MKNLLGAVAVSLVVATGATAQTVNECDWVSSARNLVEPWSQNARYFANGKIKVALLDTYEPACCSYHLLVILPDPEFGQACYVISDRPGQGWVGIRYKDLKASYDPATGLRVNIEVDHYNPDTGTADPSRRTRYGIRVNQATGNVTIEN